VLALALVTPTRATDTIERANSYMEDALRMTVHLIMSTPRISDRLTDRAAGAEQPLSNL